MRPVAIFLVSCRSTPLAAGVFFCLLLHPSACAHVCISRLCAANPKNACHLNVSDIEAWTQVKIDAVAQACGHQNTKSAVNKLSLLKKKFNLQIVTTGGSNSKKALDAAAIATGGPATPASDKVTKRATPFIKKGIAHVVKKTSLRAVKKGEGSDEESTKTSDAEEDLEDWGSTTGEEEPIPTDENGKIFPNLDLGGRVTRSASLSPKKAVAVGNAKEELIVAGADDVDAATLAAAQVLLSAAKGTQ